MTRARPSRTFALLGSFLLAVPALGGVPLASAVVPSAPTHVLAGSASCVGGCVVEDSILVLIQHIEDGSFLLAWVTTSGWYMVCGGTGNPEDGWVGDCIAPPQGSGVTITPTNVGGRYAFRSWFGSIFDHVVAGNVTLLV